MVNFSYMISLCPHRAGSPSKAEKKRVREDHARAHGRQGLLPDLLSL